ncbi:unnamed protein product, partial [Rotaria magnacalcarata]
MYASDWALLVRQLVAPNPSFRRFFEPLLHGDFLPLNRVLYPLEAVSDVAA